MRIRAGLIAYGLAGVAVLIPSADACAQTGEIQEHLTRIVGEAAGDEALLSLAASEAETVARHVQLSLIENDLSSLDEIQLHNRHVVHALDPALEPEGPGPGVGLIPTLDRIADEARMIEEENGASDPVRERAGEVARLAAAAAADGRELIQGTTIIEEASDTADVRALVPQMLSASDGIVRDIGVLEEAVTRLAEAAAGR